MQIKHLFIIILLFSVIVSAQNVNIPQEVKDSFTQLYPKATGAKWTKVDETEVYDAEYIVKFKEKGKSITAIFNPLGDFKMTKNSLSPAKLPKNITNYVKTTYGGSKISEANQLTVKSGEIFYEAIIKIGTEKISLYFDKDGEQTDKGSIE